MSVPTATRFTRELFLVQGLDLDDESIDLFRGKLAGKLGHASFAVGDDVAQIVGGRGANFGGGEGRSGKMPALGRFAVALGAVLLEGGVGREAVISGWSRSEGCCKGEDDKARGNGELPGFQV